MVEFKKQVLPRLCSPAPTRKTRSHLSDSLSIGKSTFCGAGTPSPPLPDTRSVPRREKDETRSSQGPSMLSSELKAPVMRRSSGSQLCDILCAKEPTLRLYFHPPGSLPLKLLCAGIHESKMACVSGSEDNF